MYGSLLSVASEVPQSAVYATYAAVAVCMLILMKKTLRAKAATPVLYYITTPLNDYITAHCRTLSEPFRPPGWASNRHIQTLLPQMLRKVKMHFDRQYVSMSDGGIVAIDWADTSACCPSGGISSDVNHQYLASHPPAGHISETSPVLIMLPGLSGDATCFKNVCKLAVEKGFRPVVFNKRGHGRSHLTTPKLQSFGDPSDLREVIEHIHSTFSQAYIVVIGCSAGTGLLASYIGEYRSRSLLAAGVFISPGYDAPTVVSKPFPWPYDLFLLQGLRSLIRHHRATLEKVTDVDAALKVNTYAHFEEIVYSRPNGYGSAQDYWQKNNPMRNLCGLHIPVLALSSLDDPLFPKENIPLDLCSRNPGFIVATTEVGGHCGFVEAGTLMQWSDILAVDYLQTVLEYLSLEEHQ